MRKPMVLVGAAVVLVGVVALAAANRPALPPRAPMHTHLLKPSAEWNTYYDVVTEDQRVLYWTVKTLVDVTRLQQQQISVLVQRVKDLEDPNAVESRGG